LFFQESGDSLVNFLFSILELLEIEILKLLLISSVIPQNTIATELVLYRHFLAAHQEGVEVAIASEHPSLKEFSNSIPIIPNPLLIRLSKTRLASFSHGLRQIFRTDDIHTLHNTIARQSPDAIMTVAYGTLYPIALRLAQHFKLPLITFFHDWFPDMAWVPGGLRPYLDRQFRHLYRHSDVAFCVSEGMRQALGAHPNAWVLPPIPGAVARSPRSSSSDPQTASTFRFIYAGNLSDCYGPMLRQLGQATKRVEGLQMRMVGRSPDWPLAQTQAFLEAGIYGGFLSRDALQQELEIADALLVVMSFEPHHDRRTKTSFPSKILEYCQFCKPLIIWGPAHCTAVQWGYQQDAAWVITNPNPEEALRSIQQLAADPEAQKQLGNRAKTLATTLFNPADIQQKFMDALRHL